MLWSFVVLLLWTGLGWNAFAEEAVDPLAPVVSDLVVIPDIVLQHEAGKPVLLKFKDGREAELKIRRHNILDLPMPLNITENTCSNLQAVKCNYSVNVQFSWMVFAWTKNPDKNKIGKVVYYQPEGTETEVVSVENFIFSEVLDSPEAILIPNLPPSSFTCPNYDWLPENTSGNIPREIKVSVWTQELMLENRDTGIQENRTITTANDVVFSRNKSDVFEMQKVEGRGGNLGIAELVLGDVVAWNFQKSDGELCQVAIKPSGFGQAESTFNREAQKVRSHPELVKETFIAQSFSELTSGDSPVIQDLQQMTQNPVEYFK